MPRILNTTRGERDERELVRTLGLEDRPDRLVLWAEYRLGDELVRRDAFPLPTERGPLVFTTKGELPFDTLTRTFELTDGEADITVAVCWRVGGELVRRDAHVVLKHPTVEAAAIAAALV